MMAVTFSLDGSASICVVSVKNLSICHLLDMINEC